MKQHYDFSKAERGKFYPADARFIFPNEERIKFALKEYQAGRASIGRTARLAGLTVMQIMEEATKRGIKPRISEKMIRQELGDSE